MLIFPLSMGVFLVFNFDDDLYPFFSLSIFCMRIQDFMQESSDTVYFCMNGSKSAAYDK